MLRGTKLFFLLLTLRFAFADITLPEVVISSDALKNIKALITLDDSSTTTTSSNQLKGLSLNVDDDDSHNIQKIIDNKAQISASHSQEEKDFLNTYIDRIRQIYLIKKQKSANTLLSVMSIPQSPFNEKRRKVTHDLTEIRKDLINLRLNLNSMKETPPRNVSIEAHAHFLRVHGFPYIEGDPAYFEFREAFNEIERRLLNQEIPKLNAQDGKGNQDIQRNRKKLIEIGRRLSLIVKEHYMTGGFTHEEQFDLETDLGIVNTQKLLNDKDALRYANFFTTMYSRAGTLAFLGAHLKQGKFEYETQLKNLEHWIDVEISRISNEGLQKTFYWSQHPMAYADSTTVGAPWLLPGWINAREGYLKKRGIGFSPRYQSRRPNDDPMIHASEKKEEASFQVKANLTKATHFSLGTEYSEERAQPLNILEINQTSPAVKLEMTVPFGIRTVIIPTPINLDKNTYHPLSELKIIDTTGKRINFSSSGFYADYYIDFDPISGVYILHFAENLPTNNLMIEASFSENEKDLLVSNKRELHVDSRFLNREAKLLQNAGLKNLANFLKGKAKETKRHSLVNVLDAARPHTNSYTYATSTQKYPSLPTTENPYSGFENMLDDKGTLCATCNIYTKLANRMIARTNESGSVTIQPEDLHITDLEGKNPHSLSLIVAKKSEYTSTSPHDISGYEGVIQSFDFTPENEAVGNRTRGQKVLLDLKSKLGFNEAILASQSVEQIVRSNAEFYRNLATSRDYYARAARNIQQYVKDSTAALSNDSLEEESFRLFLETEKILDFERDRRDLHKTSKGLQDTLHIAKIYFDFYRQLSIHKKTLAENRDGNPTLKGCAGAILD